MKRKLFLTFLIISILAFAFAVSASAAMTGSTSNEFGEKISLSGIDLKNMATDDGSRVVLAHTVEGVTYYNTYPANYIVTSWSYNRILYDRINAALGANGEDFTYGDTSVIRLEMPSSATNSNGEVKAMSSLKELIYMPELFITKRKDNADRIEQWRQIYRSFEDAEKQQFIELIQSNRFPDVYIENEEMRLLYSWYQK